MRQFMSQQSAASASVLAILVAAKDDLAADGKLAGSFEASAGAASAVVHKALRVFIRTRFPPNQRSP
jgi:hypothetical protein